MCHICTLFVATYLYFRRKYRMAKFRIAKHTEQIKNKNYMNLQFTICSNICIFCRTNTFIPDVQYLMRSFGETVKLFAQLKIVPL